MKIFMVLCMVNALTMCTLLAQSFHYSPPDNFLSTDSLTFENKSAAAVVQFSVFEGHSFEQFISSFSEDQLIRQQLMIQNRLDISCGNETSGFFNMKLYECTFNSPSNDQGSEVEYVRLVGFAGNNQMVLMVVASYPRIAAELLYEPLIKSFSDSLEIQQAERSSKP